MFFSGAGRQPISASPVSFLLTKYGPRGYNNVGYANTNDHRPTHTRNSFSAPEAVLNEVEQGLKIQVRDAVSYIAVRSIRYQDLRF